MLTVVIPANNEVGYIEHCLESLLTQTFEDRAEVLVAANGCTDDTVNVCRGFSERFAAKGWDFQVLDIPEGGKPGALNRADAEASGDMRAYLDADVILSPQLIEQIVMVLDDEEPRYASGKLEVTPAKSWVTRRFADIWVRLPFMADEGSVPGAGIFAVNAAGRSRWGAFPKIISDDTYVRLMFTPKERIGVPAPYSWPMIEGFRGLVKVRRRQDRGVAEIAETYPGLLEREGKSSLGLGGLARIALGQPVSFAIYAAVLITVKFGSSAENGWTRGR